MLLRKDIAVVALLLAFLIISSVCYSQETNTVNEESGTVYREGLTLFKSRKYADALEKFEKAYDLDDRNTASLYAQGLAFNNLGKYKEAAAVLEQLIEVEPGHAKGKKLYPMVLERDGRDEKAIVAYDRALKLQPEDFSLYWGKARLFIKMENFKSALVNLNSALDLNADNSKILYLKAQTLASLGRDEEAVAIAEQILKKDARHTRARLILADHKRRSGKLKEALEDYTLSAVNIETKAYAEHYINVIELDLEELEIEREFEERRKQEKEN